jgi:hypothetical protein
MGLNGKCLLVFNLYYLVNLEKCVCVYLCFNL